MAMHKKLLAALVLASWASLPAHAATATITFDTLVSGQTSFGFDGDGDGINDVVFQTADPEGFNTLGPGLAQLYISEPGLEGTTLLNPDLRVNFLNSATESISFGFAMSDVEAGPANNVSFSLFNSSNVLIGSTMVNGALFSLPGGGTSSFVEGQVVLNFAGQASYGLFNFGGSADRYIIDNFSGNFGSVIPEPGTGALMLLGAAALAWRGRQRGFRS